MSCFLSRKIKSLSSFLVCFYLFGKIDFSKAMVSFTLESTEEGKLGHTRTVAGADGILLPGSYQVYRSALMKLCDPLMCQNEGCGERKNIHGVS